MTIHGIITIDIFGIILFLWILNLIREGRLYVGYGILFSIIIWTTAIIISVPRLLNIVTRLVGAFLPVSALTLLAIGFFILMLVYIFTQLTIIANRLAVLVQNLAIQQAKFEAEQERD